MTRINVGISPKNLTDQHLLAEHREIARMRSSFLRWYNSKKRSTIPSKFCLGEGHVLFFIDKGLYTFNRYKQLYKECLHRGFDVTDYSSSWNRYRKKYFNSYRVTSADKLIIQQRIATNIKRSSQIPRYYRNNISKRKAINNLKK